MAEFVQLDTAAAIVGKSEVTLRRLIKANKIPFQKEKTLTGFIYLVNPDHVLSYYQQRDGEITDAFEGGEQPGEVVVEKDEPVHQVKPSAVRVAVANESGNLSEYWQKKSEIYEDKFNAEVQKHAQTREELGVWRGRADQAQTMLSQLLPAPGAHPHPPKKKEPAVPHVESAPAQGESSPWLVSIVVTIVILAVIGAVVLFYFRLYPKL